MADESLDHIVYSKNVIEFVTVGKEYCNIVESHTSYDVPSFLGTVQKVFPLLYLKATLLPILDEDTVEEPEKFVTEFDYNYLLNNITAKLGRFDGYQEVFDPGMQFSESPLEASIAENICDIYQDIKDFILNYRLGSPNSMADALWECRNSFEKYWGQKLVNCMRALHHLVYTTNDWEEEDKGSTAPKTNRKKGAGWLAKHFNNNSEGLDDNGI